jgi:hypothetical protein
MDNEELIEAVEQWRKDPVTRLFLAGVEKEAKFNNDISSMNVGNLTFEEIGKNVFAHINYGAALNDILNGTVEFVERGLGHE